MFVLNTVDFVIFNFHFLEEWVGGKYVFNSIRCQFIVAVKFWVTKTFFMGLVIIGAQGSRRLEVLWKVLIVIIGEAIAISVFILWQR